MLGMETLFVNAHLMQIWFLFGERQAQCYLGSHKTIKPPKHALNRPFAIQLKLQTLVLKKVDGKGGREKERYRGGRKRKRYSNLEVGTTRLFTASEGN